MGCISDSSSRDALLLARIEDAVRLSQERGCPRFLGFLDEREQEIASGLLHRRMPGRYDFFGGYEQAERRFLSLFVQEGRPPAPEDYPLVRLGFTYRQTVRLSHRDFLGTLMAAGLKWEKIGDIVCGEGLTVVFADAEIASYLSTAIQKVGGEGVKPLYPYTGGLPLEKQYQIIGSTVASPRLDALVKVALKVSREQAAAIIRSGRVSVNHKPTVSVSDLLKEGDRLSIRSAGRFRLLRLGPQTQKGRWRIEIEKTL